MTSAGAMWLSGLLLRTRGTGMMFGGLAEVTLLPLLMTGWLPSARAAAAHPAVTPSAAARPAWRAGPGVVALLVGTLLYYGMTGGVR